MVFDSYESPSYDGYFAISSGPVSDGEGRIYNGAAGIATTPNWAGVPVSGSQYLFIENYTYASSVAKTYALDPGVYSLSYWEGGRGNGGAGEPSTAYGSFTYDLVVDGNVLGTYTTGASGLIDVQRTSGAFTVGGSGTVEVKFQGHAGQPDNMGLFDDLLISAVPEPGTFAMLGIGSLFMLRFKRRRR
jgi:hypothetical protein